MKANKILVALAIIQVGLITLGGYLYSLIPNLIEEQPNISYTCINQTSTMLVIRKNATETKHSFSDSVFFVITIVTTIGYGQLTPKTDLGKIFTIIVAFIGIPINIVFLAKLGELLKKGSAYLFRPIQRLLKNKKFFIIFQLIVSIISGTIIFLLLPGVVLMKLENWSYVDALYYTFVTLFTIGFGDFVAGSELKLSPNWMTFYRFALYLWMYLGMAFISLIITLCLDYIKANAQNLRKEIINIIEEKINLTIKRYFLARRLQAKSKSKNDDTLKEDISKEELKIKVNYSQNKLTELARKRSNSKGSEFKSSFMNLYYQTNPAFSIDGEDPIQNHAKAEFALYNPVENSNEFQNDLYMNSTDLNTIDEVDDECLKIDIENLDKKNSIYETLKNNQGLTEANDYYFDNNHDHEIDDDNDQFEIILRNFIK